MTIPPRRPSAESAASREALTRRPGRRRFLLSVLVLAGCCVCARAVQVQAVQTAAWRELAAAQHRTQRVALAPRGRILARDGTELAVSVQRYSVAVAPQEIKDRPAVRRLLSERLGVSEDDAMRLTDPNRKWMVVSGRYGRASVAELEPVPGLHLQAEFSRHLLHGELVRELVGRVADGVGAGGVEQAFDHVLKGVPGLEIAARSGRGRTMPGGRVVAPPRPGGDVALTLDPGVQEIADQVLEEAVRETGAVGGDIVVTRPATGEVLALASRKADGSSSLAAVNAPYEPGSTLKPFTVAGLLETGLATLADSVDVADGAWTVAGRTLRDVSAQGRMTLADALTVSSNVGVAKMATAFPFGAQYELLRDFGFGSPTGVELPGEVAGVLRRPGEWSRQSPVSLAIGYEVSVTTLQMAMAYGALANGGLLMKPLLVKELRSPDGVVTASPVVVRRSISTHTAEAIAATLREVVDDGTGRSARLDAFGVAGKSGTSRLYQPGSGYQDGAYWASFAGFFPSEEPQLVVVAKLERPQGRYYGGEVAAPVTRIAMEAILAASASPIDRNALLQHAVAEGEAEAPAPERFANIGTEAAVGTGSTGTEASWIRSGTTPLDDRLAGEREGFPTPAGVVPNVRGLDARTAARRLHAAGLRVAWQGTGEVVETRPAAGERVSAGDTVRVTTRKQEWKREP